MRSLILNEAVWSGTNSNMTHMHAFLNGTTAACNARIKPGDSVRSGDMPLTSMAKRNANTLPTTWCEKCEAKVTAMVNRREASMAPSTGEADHLPPAAEVAEPARWAVGDRVAGQVKGQPFTGRVTNTHFKGEVLDVVHVAADQTLTTPAGRTVGRVILRGSGEIAGLSPEPVTEAAAEQVPADPELRAEIADLRTILALIRNSNCTPGQWGEVRAAVTAARDRFIQVDNARRTDPTGA